MLRFAIGVGINSVSGAQIERALMRLYVPGDDFEIVPIVESDYELTSVPWIQQRAVEFASRARYFYKAEAYFGVASGQAIFRSTPNPDALFAPVRADVVVAVVNGRQLPFKLLDPMDIRTQMADRVCGLASTHKAALDLVSHVQKHCDFKALPPPQS
jgi:hypothetical protein